ncbi:uncharacterized protein LOC136087234 [Hydra vulgaris]|uniref:Uncharacterized protein LOC136087234 n=1 Tax=Hydra vulgaris TaxID=6087 RepID=A0ABM4CV20_HYDVU
MPNNCCAVGCSNVRTNYNDIKRSFEVEKRKLWLLAIRRKNWFEKSIECARLCSDHFISDSPAENNIEPLTFEKGTQIECNQTSIQFESLQKELMERNLELYQLRDKITKLESHRFSYKNISKTMQRFNFTLV